MGVSRVKGVTPCSNAIAAIRASMVVTATPFARAARKMAAAYRYVEKPLGSSMSPLEQPNAAACRFCFQIDKRTFPAGAPVKAVSLRTNYLLSFP